MATDPTDLINGLLKTAGLGSTPNSVAAQNQQLQLGTQAIQGNALALQAARQQQQQAQQYSSMVQDYYNDPRPQKLARLAALFPSQADALQKSYQIMDAPARQSRLTNLSELYNAAKSNRSDLAAASIGQVIQAEKAQGIDTSEAEGIQQELQSGNPAALRHVQAFTQAHLAAADPAFAKTMGIGGEGFTLNQGEKRFDSDGNLIASVDPKPDKADAPQYEYDSKNERWLLKPGTGGGGQGSSGGGAVGGSGGPATGDVSRLINRDAGGGYVPDSVKTLGQFVSFGKSLNAKGARSSSAGVYQINGSTLAQFAPQILGPGWKDAPFNAQSQDAVGQAIFNWAKQQPNPAAALRGRWVSLSPSAAAQLVQGTWQDARGVIAHGETGGGPGASAAVPSGSLPSGGSTPAVINVPTGASGADDSTVGPAYLATLPAGRRAIVQSVLDGKMAAPRPGSRFGEALAEDIARVDPSFDPSIQPARMQARKDFTGNGKVGQTFTAYNRFAAHLNSAYELHLKLAGGYNGPGGDLAAQAGQSFQKDLVKQYNTEIEGAQGEFQKLTKLGVANEGEAQRLINNAQAGQSAAGRAGALKGMAALVVGGYQPLVQQWHSAFPNQPLPLDVTPGAKAAINNVLHQGTSAMHVGRDGAPQAPPAQSSNGAGSARPTHVSKSGAYSYYPGRGWVKN